MLRSVAFSLPYKISFSKRGFLDLFDAVLFLYFFTLHADQLSVRFGEITIRLNNFFAFLLLAMVLVRFRGQLFLINRWLFYGLLSIALVMLLSLFQSPYKNRCILFLGWYGFILLFYVFLPYFLIFRLNEQKIFKLYFASFLCVGIYACFQLLLSLVGWMDPFITQHIIKDSIARPDAFAYEPSFYALYMTPFVMMVNFHYLTKQNGPFFLFRSLSLKQVLFVNFLFLISTSTSTFFAYGFFFFFFFLLLWTRHFSRFYTRFLWFLLSCISMCVVVGALFPSLISNFFMKFFFHGFLSHHSFFLRFIGIKNAWSIFLNYPFLGVGMGGVPPHLLDAWFRGDLHFILEPITASVLAHLDLSSLIKFFEPTNVFTEILASLGLLGAGACLFLMGVFYQQVKRAVKKDPFIVINLSLSTLIMLIVLQFNQGLFRTYIWVHFAITFAFIEKTALKIND